MHFQLSDGRRTALQPGDIIRVDSRRLLSVCRPGEAIFMSLPAGMDDKYLLTHARLDVFQLACDMLAIASGLKWTMMPVTEVRELFGEQFDYGAQLSAE